VEIEHRAHVHGAGTRGLGREARMLLRILLRVAPLRDAPARRQVAVDEIVRRCLVGDHAGPRPAGLRAAHELGQHLGGVAEQADRHRLAALRVLLHQRERLVEVLRLLVEVARAQAEVDAGLLAFDDERRRPGEAGGQRLRAAHAAQAGGEDPAAREVAAVVLARGLGEGLVRALHDALRADVDPRARGHLAVHHQAAPVELVEVLPRGPLRHEVRIGEQHARGVGVGLEHAHRLARLHEQRLVVLQLAQAREDAVERCPVARRAADAAVDDELLGALGDAGVEVVLDHAVRGFGEPRLARERRAGGRAHDAAGRAARGLCRRAGDGVEVGGVHGGPAQSGLGHLRAGCVKTGAASSAGHPAADHRPRATAGLAAPAGLHGVAAARRGIQAQALGFSRTLHIYGLSPSAVPSGVRS
jgi:hypothetical protein